MSSLFIRAASVNDSKSILDIYSYYIENTCASFEIATPPLDDFTKRIETVLRAYPYLVCVVDDRIAGYAYASRHMLRAAYRYDIEVSVYIRNGMNGHGIGTALYNRLFEQLKKYEYYNAYAIIVLPNEKSVALHHKFGFKDIGVHHKTGYKFGKWHDVLWLEKALKDHSVAPRI